MVVNVSAWFQNTDEEELLASRPGVRFMGQVGKVTIAMLERNFMRLYQNFAGSQYMNLGADDAMLTLTRAKTTLAPSAHTNGLQAPKASEAEVKKQLSEFRFSQ